MINYYNLQSRIKAYLILYNKIIQQYYNNKMTMNKETLMIK